ncbi:hypothetical protein ACJJIF_13850 [Microbulbifer sp. SSSA002]|uniref:hypothetical protein n=1 Tax=Microbulbifer sp. SSSA002 TaxID=3243376 RepID=UPI004039BBEB
MDILDINTSGLIAIAQDWEVYWSLIRQLKPAQKAEGLTVAFPQWELHIVERAANGL